MAASISTICPSGARSCDGHNSVKKMAMARPSGTARSNAMMDVESVPTMNGTAPYTSPGGFHSVPKTNDKPKADREGSLRNHSMRPTATISANTIRADNTITVLYGMSPCCSILPMDDRGAGWTDGLAVAMCVQVHLQVQ